MGTGYRFGVMVSLAAAWFAACPSTGMAQTEPISSQPIGMDTPVGPFAHDSLPGATGIDFSAFFAISPVYGPEESHTMVVTFEWGPTAAGPWTASPDHVNTVPGGMTDLFGTGVYHGPEDAAFVRLHFYAGALMIVTGEFTHTSVIPEPGSLVLATASLTGLLAVRRRRPR